MDADTLTHLHAGHPKVVERLRQYDDPETEIAIYVLHRPEADADGLQAGPGFRGRLGRVEVYLEHVAVGAALPEMPLFLNPDRCINVPLEPSYRDAYGGMPAFWRDVLEGRQPLPR